MIREKQNTNFLYSTHTKKIIKKIQISCSQQKFSNEFQISSNSDWECIYFNKIKSVEDKKNLAEFNYKLLKNILCNNLHLSKWNSQVNKNCKVCQNETENIRH